MQRLVNPGKRLPDKAGEPDFYEISRKYPLPAAPAGAAIEPPIASPHGRPGQPGAGYPFPPQAGGFYPYGYPAGPYPQMASPTSYGQPPGFPPQPPQQAYWPNQMAPGMYPPPNPAGYGYPYPYAPQMMMPPQGYDPQSFQQPGMYGQYPVYPGTPKGGAFNPTSPSVKKPPAEGVQPQLEGQGPGPGQYPYQPAAGAEQPSGEAGEAREVDDRKPAALSGQKRSLDERPSAPTRELEGSTPPNAAGSAQGGTYNQSQYEMQQPGAGVQQPGASEGQSGGAGAEGGDAAAKQTTEGSGGAVKQEGEFITDHLSNKTTAFAMSDSFFAFVPPTIRLEFVLKSQEPHPRKVHISMMCECDMCFSMNVYVCWGVVSPC